MNIEKFAEKEEKKQHQDKLFKAIYSEPLPYYERQKQSTIKMMNTFNKLQIFENKLISFSGIPGSAKSRISLNIIQEIIEANSNYNAILFSLELNKNTAISLLAKTPVHIKHNIDQKTADKYNNMNQEYKERYLDNERVGIIDRTTDYKEKINDIETIREILNYYEKQHYSGIENGKINTFEEWKKYHESTSKEQKLIIFLDYFDILRTEDFKTEYEKQEYLINELKSFRDNYNFVTFFIINSTNKEAFKSDGGNMGSIKGNSSIIFGYDQAFNIENVSNKRLDKLNKDKSHRHKEYLKNYKSIAFDSNELADNQTKDVENIYKDEGIIIIEDTKSRYGGEGKHLYKALNGYSKFIEINPKIKTKKEETGSNKGKVAHI